MNLNKNLLFMYRYLFAAGIIIEPVWGYYLQEIMHLNDSYVVRVMGCLISLTCYLLTFNKNFFIKNVNTIILIGSSLLFVGRYYLLYLNSSDWNYIIDLYTVFIIWLIIVPEKRSMYFYTPLFIVPSVFFPFHDYVTASLLITISPLVGSMKWVFFDLSDKYEKAQEKIKESNLLLGSQKTLTLLSHQINNYLEKINLNNELLKYGENKKINDSISENIQNINKIMFSYTIKANSSDVAQFENLTEVLKEVLVELNTEKVQTNFDIKVVKVKMVKRLFKAAIANILANALFETKDLENGLVKLSLGINYDFLTIVIEDNANTLTKENLNNIFKPFFSTKSINDGCGLGLSISKDIIDGMGGETFVAINPTTFFIRFPCKILQIEA